MKKTLWLIAVFICQTHAATVIYTVQSIPPINASNAQVVYLDQPDILQQQFFQLPEDPQQAELAARAILKSQSWPEKQRELIQSYQGVLNAYQLKLEKYPAVVFDNRWVVYGTADALLAEQYLNHEQREAN